MAKHVFKGNVHHDKIKFKKGDLCPDALVDHMNKIGVIQTVEEPSKPSEPKKA